MALWLQTWTSVKDVLAMKVSDEVKVAAILAFLRAITAITSQTCVISRWC